MKGGELVDGSTVKDIRLAAIARQAEYRKTPSIKKHLPVKSPVSRLWHLDMGIPQGFLQKDGIWRWEGTCVLATALEVVRAEPILTTQVSTPDGLFDLTYEWGKRELYYWAQAIDPYDGAAWPPAGGKFAEGTDMISMAKMLKRWDLIGDFKRVTDFDQLLRWLSHGGPAFVGIPWFEPMYEPDEKGICRIVGVKVGYHAITYLGLDMEKKTIPFQNHWHRPGIEKWGIEIDGVEGRANLKFSSAANFIERNNTEVYCLIGK